MKTLLTLLIAASALVAQQSTCHTVHGSQILGSDLAQADPAFQAVPASLPLAPTPSPGGVRIFRIPELQNLAARHGIVTAPSRDICFRLATAPLERETVLAELQASIGATDARIEILELSSDPVPAGRLEFARDRLAQPARTDQVVPVLWNGDVVNAQGRRFPIWARVRITAPVTRLVATEELRPGVEIRSDQVRLETSEGFPGARGNVTSIAEVEGKSPIRLIAAKGVIQADNLTRPVLVNRGDSVRVEVRLGVTRIGMTGLAEAPGRTGDTVSVRNPTSGRLFSARVEGRGAVVVEPLRDQK